MFKKNKIIEDTNTQLDNLDIDEKEEKVIEDFKELNNNFIKDDKTKQKIIDSIRNDDAKDIGIFCEVIDDDEKGVYARHKNLCLKNKQIRIVFLRDERQAKKIKAYIDGLTTKKEPNYDDIVDKIAIYLKSEDINYEIDYQKENISIFTYKGNIVYDKDYFKTSGDFYGMGIEEYKQYLLDLRITVDVLIQVDKYRDELGRSIRPI